MAQRYDQKAIDYCLRLYLRYNGERHEKIEEGMHRAGWTGWKRHNLYPKGKGRNRREGWIEKYRWEKALATHQAQLVTASTTLNNAEKLVREVEHVRALLYEEINSQGGTVEKERLQLHRDYCNLSIAALTKIEAARDTLGAWVSFWERLTEWAPDIEMRFSRMLIKYSDAVIARAEAEFGEKADENLMDVNSTEEAIPGTQA